MLKGTDRILYFKISDVWTPIGCLTSNSITESSEMLTTTTRDNQGWETSVPGSQSYSIPFAGIVPVDGTGKVTITTLRSLKRAKVRIEWKLEDTNNNFIDIGKGYLTSIGETADVGDFLVFDAELLGYGQPTQYVDDNPPTAPILGLGAGGSNFITIFWVAATDDVGIASYNIYRKNVLFDSVSGTTLFYDDYAIVDGGKYSYNVSAVDTAGNEGPLSNKVFPGTTSKPGEEYLELESGTTIDDVLLLESNGGPLILESS